MNTTDHMEPDADDQGGPADYDEDDALPVGHPDHHSHAARERKQAEHAERASKHAPTRR